MKNTTFKINKNKFRELTTQEINQVAGADVTTSDITQPTVTVQTVTVGTTGNTTTGRPNQTK